MSTPYEITNLRYATFDKSVLGYTLTPEGTPPVDLVAHVDGSDGTPASILADLLALSPAPYVTPFSITDAQYTGSKNDLVTCTLHGGKGGPVPANLSTNGDGVPAEIADLLSRTTIEAFIPPKDAYYVDAEKTRVNCKILHPRHGWISTTVAVDGADDRPALAYEVSVLDIAPYVAPVVSVEEREADAKVLRDHVLNSDIEVFEVVWQIDKTSRDLIKEVTDYAERAGRMAEGRGWLLADNSPRLTTATELLLVKDAYVQRLDTVFAAYAAWKAGDKSAAFSV